MITLRKANHFCFILISQDLFGGWHVTRKSGSINWPSVHTKNFEFSDELSARLKLFDIETNKRSHGYIYKD